MHSISWTFWMFFKRYWNIQSFILVCHLLDLKVLIISMISLFVANVKDKVKSLNLGFWPQKYPLVVGDHFTKIYFFWSKMAILSSALAKLTPWKSKVKHPDPKVVNHGRVTCCKPCIHQLFLSTLTWFKTGCWHSVSFCYHRTSSRFGTNLRTARSGTLKTM